MTAALAEAPGVAWFVPVTVPTRSPRRLALVGSPGRAGSGARTAARTPPPSAAPRLRLTRRGAHVVALAALAHTLLGGVGRLEGGPSIGAASTVRMAPGTPLTSPSAAVVTVPGN